MWREEGGKEGGNKGLCGLRGREGGRKEGVVWIEREGGDVWRERGSACVERERGSVWSGIGKELCRKRAWEGIFERDWEGGD